MSNARLDSFVAGALLRRLHRAGPADTTGPVAVSFTGAVLFVDISGYTRLAEALCAEGDLGIERLGKILETAFQRYVNTVQDFGGEVACFAGDAFVVYWPADGDLGAATQQAERCARTLHAGVGEADEAYASAPAPDDDSVAAALPPARPPRLHIGLSHGRIWAARLGGRDRWQVLLAGPAVRAACSAALLAVEGTTVTQVAPAPAPDLPVSSPVDAGAAGFAPVVGHRDAAAPPADEATQPASVAEFIGQLPQRAHESLAGDDTWIPQRRTIHALFVRLSGIDEEATDGLSRCQAAIEALRRALRPFTAASGVLVRDDKGLVFTLCFGLPHDALGDDGLRAVRAGLAARRALEAIGVPCGIGLSSGVGVYMALGGSLRRTYWTVGAFMHRAARLMEASDGRLLCTMDVAAPLGLERFTLLEPPLRIKGMAEPLRVCVPDEAILSAGETPLFGRERETARLDAAVEAFAHGEGTVLWITGEAGIGKSALLTHLERRLASSGARRLRGQSASMERSIPYAPWRTVFGRLIGDDDAGGVEERRARLGPLRHPDRAPLINAVLPGFLPETALTQSVTGQARADATMALLTEVLIGRASEQFVLVLEDCHWMDSASWRLLLRVAQDCPQALIVATARPSADDRDVTGLRTLDRYAGIHLEGLTTTAIAALIEQTLDRREAFDASLLQDVAARSAGNPLFAREFALLRRRRAGPGEAGRRQSGAGADAVPGKVQSLIAGRLDTLGLREELALKTAAVLGDRFSADLLETVCPSDDQRGPFDSILASLQTQQLIVAEADAVASYRFQHALIRQVAYEQLTHDQRQRLHRRAAESIERQHQPDLQAHLGVLAHHWRHAGARAATIRFSDLAAAQALGAGAFEEADRLLSHCVEVAGQSADVAVVDRVRWYRQLADARNGMGQLTPRIEAAHQALRLAGVSRPSRRWRLVAASSARLLTHLARRPTTVSPGLVLDIARAHRHSAEVCYFNDDIIGMICDSVSAVVRASALPPCSVLAGATAELGGILTVAGLRRRGERILRSALAMAEAVDDHAAQAYTHMISCLHYVGIGDWERAQSSAARCQALCEPMEDRVNWTNAQAVRFWMNHYCSREAEALEAAYSLRDRASQTGNRQHRAWAARFLGLCALRRGETESAIEHLTMALRYLGRTRALNERIPALGLLALAYCEHGDLEKARRKATLAMVKVEKVGRPIGHSTLEGYSALAATALRLWQSGGRDAGRWRTHAERCLGVLRRYAKGFPVGAPRYQLHRGDLQRLSGQAGAARRSYARGAMAARRLEMPWDRQRCESGLSLLGLRLSDS